jgi:hypothetical protein
VSLVDDARRFAQTEASPMLCQWCEKPIPGTARRDSIFCSQRCRQAAWRFGLQARTASRADKPLRIAYADPPYPGLADRYYRDHPDFAGEVDHVELLSRLQGFDGWALSTSAKSLGPVLEICRNAMSDRPRVAAWFRGARASQNARRAQSAWEPVIYWGGRLGEPGEAERLDALVHVARPRTTDPKRVIGSKPAAFAYWMFDLLGARPGDQFVDLFPGSGGIMRAWQVYESRSANADASGFPGQDASVGAGKTDPITFGFDASAEYSSDGSESE